ncbi:MAG: DNA primase [Oscillospiraceae bacterium]|jgi:DNA primase|nr:DNA primase [Oscillospiraceae bacterium]
MAISEDIIERIRLSNNIESIVREYLPDLKKAGRNWKACCPFHNEKTPSFVVSPQKGIFRCFGCNTAGDVFKFVMLADNISWIEAVRKLAQKAGITIQETKKNITKASEKSKIFDILENSAIFYHRCLLESSSAGKVRDYLKSRGITNDTINKFNLGFAPKGQLLQLALKKGHTTDELAKAGLMTKTERGTFFEYMSERIVFPIYDAQGRVVAFGGRTIGNQEPKYLNTPETIVYSKSSNLYGLYQTLSELRKERKMIILEGYMDVVIPQQFGIVGAVATLGTAFTQNHAKLIARYSDDVTLLFDADNAGRTATQKALEVLTDTGIEAKVSSLPEHVDADEYLNQHGKEKFLKLLSDSSKSAIDFMIDRIYRGALPVGKAVSPETKAKLVSILLDFVSKSSNTIIQREWIKKIAQHVNVDEEAVWREFKKKQNLKIKGYFNDKFKNLASKEVKNKKITMSLEENLLNLILNNRDYIERVGADFFQDARCQKIYGLLASDLSDAEILNELSPEETVWFSELTLNSIEYNDVNEAFLIILKDMEEYNHKRRRQQLEKEILLMTEGKKEKDSTLFEEYKKLTTLLKGSGN